MIWYFYIFFNINTSCLSFRTRPWQSCRTTWCWWSWTCARRQPALLSSTTRCRGCRRRQRPPSRNASVPTGRTCSPISLLAKSPSCTTSWHVQPPVLWLPEAGNFVQLLYDFWKGGPCPAITGTGGKSNIIASGFHCALLYCYCSCLRLM